MIETMKLGVKHYAKEEKKAMYKMLLNTVPQYLCDAIANFRENVQYNTRNEDTCKYILSKC